MESCINHAIHPRNGNHFYKWLQISQFGIEHDELKNLDGNYHRKSNLTKKSSEMR